MSGNLQALEQALRRTLPMARIETVPLPGCEEITLGLINRDFPTGPLPGDVMHDVIAEPAYWSLCWGSGLALARFLLREPERVAGLTVTDLGSGSGVAGIAAALAGARTVTACDTDPDARLATSVNARINGVEIAVSDTLPPACDLLLMADVLYDRENLPLLEVAQRHANAVLVADSRVTQLPDPAYREIARIDALTFPNLGEFDEFGTAHLFFWERPTASLSAQPAANSSNASP
jgi:predicted nicotinamide N-methyase